MNLVLLIDSYKLKIMYSRTPKRTPMRKERLQPRDQDPVEVFSSVAMRLWSEILIVIWLGVVSKGSAELVI